MLEQISLIGWLRLFMAMILFLGPGALIGYLLNDKHRDLTSYVIYYSTYSASFWIVLLNLCRVTHIFPIDRNNVFLISTIGWVLYLYNARRRIHLTSFSWKTSLVWLLCLVAWLVIIHSLRGQVAGLGSDSFHHTLIPNLIILNSGLPNHYGPAYPEIITMNYHTGFHVIVAILVLLSRWETRLIVLLMMPILVIGSGLAINHFINERSHDKYSPSISAMIPMFLFAFPIGMLEWGRYPQTLGLIFLVMFMSEYLKMPNLHISFKRIIALALLGVVILYTHYRVAIITFVGVTLWEIWIILSTREADKLTFRYINLLKISFLCCLLLLPLIVNIFRNSFVGYPVQYQGPTNKFIELSRLGEPNLFYIPNIITYLIFLYFLVKLITSRDNLGAYLFLWWILLVGLALLINQFYFYSLDPITVYASLYIPISLIIGLGLSKTFPYRKSLLWEKLFLSITFILLVVGSVFLHIRLQKTVPISGFVKVDDLKALKWIRKYTPSNACFMVSTFNFPFSSNFIIGSDGGWWLPALANRCVITYPMIANIERFDHPNALDKTVRLHQLRGNIDNELAFDLLQSYNVQYVYASTNNNIGGSVINPFHLSKSSYYELIYNNHSIYIFKLRYKQTSSPR